MQELEELERRIAVALDRIAAGIEALDMPEGGSVAPPSADLDRLAEELAAERDANAQLTARLEALHARAAGDATGEAGAEDARVEQLTRQVDEQALEIQRLKSQNVALREAERAAREELAKAGTAAGADGAEDGLRAELDALRRARADDLAELDELLARIQPLIEEDNHA